MKIRIVTALGILLAQAACAVDQVLPRTPTKAGTFNDGVSCQYLVGRFLPKGECLSDNCSSQSSLLDVLGHYCPEISVNKFNWLGILSSSCERRGFASS